MPEPRQTHLSAKRIEVADYDPQWPDVFWHLRDKLWPLIKDVALGIEHVGSTAVPGLAVKPVLDIDVVLPSPELLPLVCTRLLTAGYVHRGNLGIEGREAFKTPAGLPKHHLYVCDAASLAFRSHIALRDHLRTHPADATTYSTLKKDLAKRFPDDINAYTAGKTEFITSVLARCGFLDEALQTLRKINEERTGLVCPQCRQRVAVIENRLPHTIVFRCPACDYRWGADEPGTQKH
jgi:GrpB-like predicted nucleotidyltransferase (UPF0157 family)